MDQDAIWFGGRPLPRPHYVRCQTAGWIKMKLGTEVGLGYGHIVLDGTQLPSQRGTAPQFSVYVYCGQMVAHLSYC